MKKIGIIINPNSKKFRTHRSSLRHYKNLHSELIDIRRTETAEDVKPAIEDFINSGYQYVAVAGGDGTLHLALTELIKICSPDRIPPLLILKEGTMNNVARTINLKGRGPDLIKRLIWSLENERAVEIHERDTIKVENRYCFLFGTGMITNFLDEVYGGREKGLKRNIEVAAMTALEAVKNSPDGKIFKMTEGDVIIDGKKIPMDKVNGILSATVEHVGMGFSPLIDADSLSQAFQTIVIGMAPRKILMNINRIRTGKHIKDEGYFNSMTRDMILRFPGEFEYTMDGDMYVARDELYVETGPRIRLVKV